MAGFIGLLLVVLAAGATLAALSRPILEIILIIRAYIQGIYGRSTARKNPPQL